MNSVLKIEDGIAWLDISTAKHPHAVTQVCEADLPLVLDGGSHWYAARYRDRVYVIRGVRVNGAQATELLHRRLCRCLVVAELCDHRNRDSLDNRHTNLRRATSQQNGVNCREYARASRYIGVGWDASREKWVACLKLDGKQYRKRFENELDAAQHRDSIAKARYGVFARLNFPMDLAA